MQGLQVLGATSNNCRAWRCYFFLLPSFTDGESGANKPQSFYS